MADSISKYTSVNPPAPPPRGMVVSLKYEVGNACEGVLDERTRVRHACPPHDGGAFVFTRSAQKLP
eukprot:1146078-Pyramimonas_sp.AAC.2